jgi:hypothetical protein
MGEPGHCGCICFRRAFFIASDLGFFVHDLGKAKLIVR